MVRIAVHGADGRLGRLIAVECGEAFAGAVTPEAVPPCDVVVDATSPAGTGALLGRLSGQPLVVGTTGDLPMEALAAYAKRAPVAVVPNFSVGVPLLLEMVRMAVPRLPEGWKIEVVEVHHEAKKDAPSGTAKRLVRAVGHEVPTHSLRAGDTVGEHTVWLVGPGERLELKHVATRREVFAIGAVRWARDVATRPAGLYLP